MALDRSRQYGKTKLPQRIGMSYKERDCILETLGYASYAEYLQSPLWKGIRISVFQRFKKRCAGCGRRATQVHHKEYSKAVLLGKILEPLVAICRECHEWCEFITDGIKSTLMEANMRLEHLIAKGGISIPSSRDWLKKPDRKAPKEQQKTTNRLCIICRKNPTRKNRQCCRKCVPSKTTKPKTAIEENCAYFEAIRANKGKIQNPNEQTVCKGCGCQSKRGFEYCRRCLRLVRLRGNKLQVRW